MHAHMHTHTHTYTNTQTLTHAHKTYTHIHMHTHMHTHPTHCMHSTDHMGPLNKPHLIYPTGMLHARCGWVSESAPAGTHMADEVRLLGLCAIVGAILCGCTFFEGADHVIGGALLWG